MTLARELRKRHREKGNASKGREESRRSQIVLLELGKPVIKGTRIPVELILERLAEDLDTHELFADYPRLTEDDMKACLAYVQALVEGEDIYPLEKENSQPSQAHL